MHDKVIKTRFPVMMLDTINIKINSEGLWQWYRNVWQVSGSKAI